MVRSSFTMALPVPWKQTLVVAAAALMALASLALSVGMSVRLQDRLMAVQTVTDLRRQIMVIGTSLREAEAAQRMYVITGEDAHLAPLSGAQQAMPRRWKNSRETVDRVHGFSPDLSPLEQESMEALMSLEATAQVRREEGREAAVQRVVLGKSYQKLMALHMKMESLLEELDVRIEDETRTLALAEARGRAAGLTAGLLALVLGGVSVWQWRQSLGHYRRELTLNAEKARAEQMAQDKSDFLAAMSHEVRTPLNAILGMSEQLHATLPPGGAMQQAAAISTAGRGMLRLVNDLLDLSRMEAGHLELQCCAVALGGEIDWVRGLFGPRAAERGIVLEASATADLPSVVWLDEVRFRQIVTNLVGNSLKFTPPGGTVKMRLERAENPDGSELVLEVKDTGCGIPMEMQASIFQPYVQGLSENRSSSESGTGLGLAIVRQLVQLMQGKISLQSAPGSGATFRISLPLTLPPKNFKHAPASHPPLVDWNAPSPGVLPKEENPSALNKEHANELRHILDDLYAPARSTQSTRDVEALAQALSALAATAQHSWLATQADDLHQASSTFAVSTLSKLLEQLPARLAPLMTNATNEGKSPPHAS
jgi:signal transduction histidine kinase